MDIRFKVAGGLPLLGTIGNLPVLNTGKYQMAENTYLGFRAQVGKTLYGFHVFLSHRCQLIGRLTGRRQHSGALFCQ